MTPDRQLQAAARTMVATAETGRSVLPVLKKLYPDIHRQIRADRRHAGLLSLWGRCVNVDENTGQVIVDPAILLAIGELAGVPMRGRIVHAGLQHTYGYLFSLIDTPYGAKRDRWVSTELEDGLGIDCSLLGECPREGTLLANATWLLGRIAYRNCPAGRRRLDQNAAAVATELVQYDFDRLPVRRIVERVELASAATTNRTREVFLITDLVPLPRPPRRADADNTLLVYSVRTSTRSLRLVTAFPVRPAVVEGLVASVPVRGTVPIRLRYNAYVPGLQGRTVEGRRYFEDLAQN